MNSETQSRRPGRSEKLSALAGLIGDEAMRELRSRHAGFAPELPEAGDTDRDRVEWQRHRLLERLRVRWDETNKARAHEPDKRVQSDPAHGRSRFDRFIPEELDMATLHLEHPAVIAQILQRLGRPQRIAVLQNLPGQTSRAALRRLRSSGSR